METWEVLINALCHRQWEKQNLTISIAVYDDRVEIANPGVFPPQIPIENIKDSHESYPYNPNMAHALYRSTFLESWGSGIHRIIEACREQGVDDPSWRWDGAFVYVTFKRPSEVSYVTKNTLGKEVPQNAENVLQNTDSIPQNAEDVFQNKENVPQNSKEKPELNIKEYITYNPSISREEIATKLHISTKTVGRYTAKMGIYWEGHPKTGHWVIPNLPTQDYEKDKNESS